MAYFPSNDYTLEVRRGNVPGHSMVGIRGHNEALGTTRVTVAPTLVSNDLDQSAIDTTPAVVSVASTDANDIDTTGTGLRSLTLYGLDASGAEQNETILMNGQTAVVSSNTYSAITGWEQLTTGSGNENAGTIWVGTGTFTAGVPAVRLFSGAIGHNNGLSAYYVVPAANKFYPQLIIGNVATASKDVEFFLEYSNDGSTWIVQGVFGLVSGATIVSELIALEAAIAGQHVRVRAESSAATSDVKVYVSGELVED